MDAKQQALMGKNHRMWSGAISKLEALESRTPDQEEELEYRKAQLTVWGFQLKHAPDAPNAGDMSASSGVKTTEKAGAS